MSNNINKSLEITNENLSKSIENSEKTEENISKSLENNKKEGINENKKLFEEFKKDMKCISQEEIRAYTENQNKGFLDNIVKLFHKKK